MDKTAVIDPTGAYRYHLSRSWDSTLPRVCYIMLNPSTADADNDDPTIRRCISFAQSWGHGSISVVNLYAYRTKSPEILRRYHGDTIGPENYEYLRREILQTETNDGIVVCAWGTKVLPGLQDKIVCGLISSPFALKITADGFPGHPLYVKGDTRPIPYSWLENRSTRVH